MTLPRAMLPDRRGADGHLVLDREYSPSTMARDMASALQRYRRLSDLARVRRQVFERVAYGSSDADVCHVFPAPGRPEAPTLVFVHGGHWQESGIDDACFSAGDVVDAGLGFVAVGYGLAPKRSLEEMIDAVARALGYLSTEGHHLGVGRSGLHVAGSSAGAHLLAAALTRPDVPRVRTAHLMSGLYDLTDIPRTYVNEAVGLTDATSVSASPLRMSAPACDTVQLSVGRSETRTYLSQQDRYAAHLRSLGVPVHAEIVEDHDHFTLPLTRFDGSTSVGRSALAWIRRADAAAATTGMSRP